MWLVAFKGVLAHKLRLLLTSFAIVLGVAFVSGAFLLTDSMRASFDSLFTEAVQGIDVEVQTQEYKDLAKKAATAQPGTVPIDVSQVGMPPEALEQIRGVDGVERAEGTVFELGAQPLDKDGEPLGGQGPPSFAAGWVEGAEDLGALRIVKGDAPDPGQVLLDENTFDKGDFAIGDTVRVLIQGGRKVEDLEVAGAVRFGTSSTLNGATITVFQTDQVQELLDLDGRYTAVDVVAEDGISPDTLKRRVAAELGRDYAVVTGAEFAAEQTEAIDSGFLGILQNVILAFAAVAVFVGAFVIFNIFAIIVSQRVREFGMLRCAGAARGQIMSIVAIEALVLGLVGSTIGLLAGFGVATAIRELLNSVGSELPGGSFPLRTRTVLWAFGVGVIVTFVASIIPAFRASRMSPLDALRGSASSRGGGWKAPAAGGVLALIGMALVAYGFAGEDLDTSTILSSIGGGFAVMIVGLALLSRLIVAPVSRAFGLVFARGTTGQIAVGNLGRNKARAATTASALMIGLALASLVLVFYASLGRSVDKQISDVVGADVSIYNSSAQGGGVALVGEEVLEQVRDVDGVDLVVGQRYGGTQTGTARFDATSGDVDVVTAFDADALGDEGIVKLTIKDGDRLPGDGVLVEEKRAAEEGLAIGDELQFAFAGNRERTLEVKGTFEANQITGAPFILDTETFDELQPEQLRAPAFVYVNVDEGTAPRTVVNRIKEDLGRDASFLEVQDTEQLREQFNEQLAPILGIVLAMLSLSLIVALFGIATTMALNVFERTREIGLLRAVGGTRRQLRRMIRVESVLVALFGALVGIVVGIIAGRALIYALRDEGFVFGVNPVAMGAVLLAGLAAGLLAAIWPARRAARMNVLEAISHD